MLNLMLGDCHSKISKLPSSKMYSFSFKKTIIYYFFSSILIAVVAIFLHQPSLDNYPELGKTLHELIESRGFHHESHFVQTKEGYILQLVRIVNPHEIDRIKLKPVLLHHGFECSGSFWLIAANGTLRSDGTYWEEEVMSRDKESVGNSLGFVLASRGYDVWLANYRGNIYSTNHTTLDTEDEKFWQFSIDDMARVDLPALIHYVKDHTGKQSIGFIGHSLGNIMMFSLLSAQPQYSHFVKPYISIAPSFYTSKMSGIGPIVTKFRKQILRYRPKYLSRHIVHRLRLPQICTNPFFQTNVCFWFIKMLVGSEYEQMDFNRLPIYLDNMGLGASTRNVVHLLQMVTRVNPTYFDYEDELLNLKAYNQTSPPEYDVSSINSTDIALIYAQSDAIYHLNNVRLLKSNLKVKLIDDYVVPVVKWGHLELLLAKDVGRYVNSRVLNILERY